MARLFRDTRSGIQRRSFERAEIRYIEALRSQGTEKEIDVAKERLEKAFLAMERNDQLMKLADLPRKVRNLRDENYFSGLCVTKLILDASLEAENLAILALDVISACTKREAVGSSLSEDERLVSGVEALLAPPGAPLGSRNIAAQIAWVNLAIDAPDISRFGSDWVEHALAPEVRRVVGRDRAELFANRALEAVGEDPEGYQTVLGRRSRLADLARHAVVTGTGESHDRRPQIVASLNVVAFQAENGMGIFRIGDSPERAKLCRAVRKLMAAPHGVQVRVSAIKAELQLASKGFTDLAEAVGEFRALCVSNSPLEVRSAALEAVLKLKMDGLIETDVRTLAPVELKNEEERKDRAVS